MDRNRGNADDFNSSLSLSLSPHTFGLSLASHNTPNPSTTLWSVSARRTGKNKSLNCQTPTVVQIRPPARPSAFPAPPYLLIPPLHSLLIRCLHVLSLGPDDLVVRKAEMSMVKAAAASSSSSESTSISSVWPASTPATAVAVVDVSFSETLWTTL
jgi:hypothetical protein